MNLISCQGQSVNNDICQQNAGKLWLFKFQAAQLNRHVSLNILGFWCISSSSVRILWGRYKSVTGSKNNFQPINVNRKLAKLKMIFKTGLGHIRSLQHHLSSPMGRGRQGLSPFNRQLLWLCWEVGAQPASLVSFLHCNNFFSLWL